jgi:hypothetical protein
VRSLGLGRIDSKLFATSDADLGLFRKLIKQGCDPHTAMQVLI